MSNTNSNNISPDFNNPNDEAQHLFLKSEAEFGIAIRGGAFPSYFNTAHLTRLVSNVNLLSSAEYKQLAFGALIR